MAPKDYVARGRNKKPAPPPPRRSLPWLRIFITLILIGSFGYFLWSINGKAPDTKPEVNTKTQTKEDNETLPEIPDEEWEFIKTLPEYTVEIEQQEQDQPAVRRLMQCGSFRLKEQANELKANIAFQGLVAQVRSSQGSSGLWYRVILGPYDSKRLAEKDRHILQRAKINGCKIWNWNLS